MRRLTLVPLAALLAIAACTDIATSPQDSFSRPQLAESNPPPPEVDAEIGLGADGTFFSISASYFLNKPGNNATLTDFSGEGVTASPNARIHSTKKGTTGKGTLQVEQGLNVLIVDLSSVQGTLLDGRDGTFSLTFLSATLNGIAVTSPVTLFGSYGERGPSTSASE
ncbi:MAG: hypothetical protein WKG32_04405 [Gemmatimonadaceae bacterium]